MGQRSCKSCKETNQQMAIAQQQLPSLPTDLDVTIAEYLGDKDVMNMSSTSKMYNNMIKQDETFNDVFCSVATGKGLTCNTETMAPSCTEWCQRNNSIRKFYSFFELLHSYQNERKSFFFRFDNQPKYLEGGGIYGADIIVLKISDGSKHKLVRYSDNNDDKFNLTDSSYEYKTYYEKDGRTYYRTHVHSPKTILDKLERMTELPFVKWGKWELIIHVYLYNDDRKKSNMSINNEPIPGKLFFGGLFIPCMGKVTRACGRGMHTVEICIPSESGAPFSGHAKKKAKIKR